MQAFGPEAELRCSFSDTLHRTSSFIVNLAQVMITKGKSEVSSVSNERMKALPSHRLNIPLEDMLDGVLKHTLSGAEKDSVSRDHRAPRRTARSK